MRTIDYWNAKRFRTAEKLLAAIANTVRCARYDGSTSIDIGLTDQWVERIDALLERPKPK